MFRLPIFSVSGNINCTTDSECPDGMVCYNRLCTGREFYPQLSVYFSQRYSSFSYTIQKDYIINKILILAVHCQWNDWVNGTCSKTCGAGVQNNTRTKHVEEFNGGTCTGKFWEVLECEVQPCPSNAVHLILYKTIIIQLLTISYVLYIFEIIFCHSSL